MRPNCYCGVASFGDTVTIHCLAQQKHSDVPANKHFLVATTNIPCGAASTNSTDCRQSIANGSSNGNDVEEKSPVNIAGKVRRFILRKAAENL